MRPLWEVADFVREVRRSLRFGDFSRAPLQLVRLELRGHCIECDWAARPADAWDASLRRPIRDRNESFQALADAMKMRDLLFDALPAVETAVLRAFRQPAREPPELIVIGAVSREAPYILKVSSLVMRAKLYGFQFDLEDGILRPLRIREFIVSEVLKEPQFDQEAPRGKEAVIYGSQ